ncbi:dual specificity protein kinase CLK2-like isoform X2 [Solea solea]|uniref:dual specificity protein kinase CLK2-like isoform X2 n=1 Tax=Solea solea TaxID=90069 RepID=UPI002729A8C4|nr:dual specificity protein kinase CLK2-like isoform X2 [Solea solea]
MFYCAAGAPFLFCPSLAASAARGCQCLPFPVVEGREAEWEEGGGSSPFKPSSRSPKFQKSITAPEDITTTRRTEEEEEEEEEEKEDEEDPCSGAETAADLSHRRRSGCEMWDEIRVTRLRVDSCMMGVDDSSRGSRRDADASKPDVVHSEEKTGSFNLSEHCTSSETETSQEENSLRLESASLGDSGVGADDDDDDGGGGGRSDRAASCEDDGEGHLVYHVGLVMKDRYQVVSPLGAGAFGKVVKCIDRETGECVAVKIVRNIDCFREVARSEIAVLEEINALDDDNRFACVRMLDRFDHEGHVCIVFELLGLSTFEFLRQKRFRPYTVEQIRHMAFQIFRAICFLHRNKLTHTDLKPENILFVNDQKEIQLRSPDVKVVDFGTATFDHEHHESVVSTRHYRAPEVILDLGWNQSCDVWSLGCVLMEFYLGRTLFPTHNSEEHLAMMEKVLGPIPSHLLKQTRKQHYVHNERLNWDDSSSSDDYIGKHCKPLTQCMQRKSEEERQLLDLVACMLEYDVCRRITLEEALWHPFFSPVRAQKQRKLS